jgi:hypothetical protein
MASIKPSCLLACLLVLTRTASINNTDFIFYFDFIFIIIYVCVRLDLRRCLFLGSYLTGHVINVSMLSFRLIQIFLENIFKPIRDLILLCFYSTCCIYSIFNYHEFAFSFYFFLFVIFLIVSFCFEKTIEIK